MRLDRFLKVSRLSKRRSEAHEATRTRPHHEGRQGAQTRLSGQARRRSRDSLRNALRHRRVREVPLRVTPGVKPADLYEILDQRARTNPRVDLGVIDRSRPTPKTRSRAKLPDSGSLPRGAAARASRSTAPSAERRDFVTHRNAVARLFWSLLDDRKSHPIETRGRPGSQRPPTFAIAVPERSARAARPKPAH